ncbi:MAG: GtrA family protein [Terriglobales bacterium]
MIATASRLRAPSYWCVCPRASDLSAVTTTTQPATSSTMVMRYLAVGACNTAFGYGCFALFTFLLTPLIAYSYVVASLCANLFAITFSFLGYKWFVFRTHGNYLKEWVRCVGVYTGSMLLSAAALPFVVAAVRSQTGNDRTAPYIAGAIVLVFSVFFSFFGHRHISFRGSKPASQSAR